MVGGAESLIEVTEGIDLRVKVFKRFHNLNSGATAPKS
jgi:hypothetical protein